MKRLFNVLEGPVRAPEDDDFGGGGGVDTDVIDDQGDIYDDGGEVPNEDEEVAAPEAPPEQQIPLSALQQVVSTLQQGQQPAQPEPQLTPEQIDEQFKVFRPDLKLAQSMFGEDATEEHVAALQQMTAGIVDHLSTVMGYSNKFLVDELNKQYSPALEMAKEQQMNIFVGGITDRWPALKGQDQAIRRTIAALKADENFSPANGEEAARIIAGQVEAWIKTVNPSFTLAQAPKQGQQQTTMPQMASLGEGGAGGGAGNAGRKQGAKQPFNAIWE